MTPTTVPWTAGRWTTPPPAVRERDTWLVVDAAQGSDYWRQTLYGFTHDSGHGLLAPWPEDSAVEVTFRLDGFSARYDQAGLLLWDTPTRWIKAGVEINDGVPHLGAVVTDDHSDWSLAPVPDWAGETITVRASRAADAVILRARTDDRPWRTIRVSRFAPGAPAQAGPFTCAPTRSGLTVVFTRWRHTAPDQDLHLDPPTD
ncbi:MAG: DUF1349 domain-containing protein [Dactylosporangium sp.]|nr:DUF1349 domain-containing protein [Dactylosporangium sp.]NNJ59491.1 DUF1349 domain-containing protein [Dactylosporangium sp.]